MNPTLWSVGVALLWAAGAGLITWIATWPLHRRSSSWLLASVVLTGTLASVGAIFGSVRSMFISASEEAMVLSVAVVAGAVAAVGAAAAGRRLTRDNETLRKAIGELGSGRVPPASTRPLNAELELLQRELAETAQRLAQSGDRERALESSRRDLVAWVSHDLRTPLAGLRAMAEALEDGVGEPGVHVKQIRTEVDRLSTMVDDLFELSRLQSGLRSAPAALVSLVDLVSDCVASLEPLATVHDVQLSGSADDVRGQATVHGSGHDLNRAMANLISNAIRHTRPEGKVVVTVRAERGSAEIAVRDECGGIDPDEIERVFEVGYRGEPARTPRADDGSGAGLGLAITRGIVEAHDGTVAVKNVDDGCRFVVRLPIAN